jgi:hypothetical protein
MAQSLPARWALPILASVALIVTASCRCRLDPDFAWEEVPDLPTFLEYGHRPTVRNLAVAGDYVYALGALPVINSRSYPLIERSTDGLEWEAVVRRNVFSSGPTDPQALTFVSSLVDAGDKLIAFGGKFAIGTKPGGAIVSVDGGATWAFDSTLEVDENCSNSIVVDIPAAVVTEDGFVYAFGTADDYDQLVTEGGRTYAVPRALIWRADISTSPLEWDNFYLGWGWARIHAAAYHSKAEPKFIAVGTRLWDAGDGRILKASYIWVSDDGQSWLGDADWSDPRPQGADRTGAQTLLAVLLHSGSYVVAGSDEYYNPETIRPLVWQRYPGSTWLVANKAGTYGGFRDRHELCSLAHQSGRKYWAAGWAGEQNAAAWLYQTQKILWFSCASWHRFNLEQAHHPIKAIAYYKGLMIAATSGDPVTYDRQFFLYRRQED